MTISAEKILEQIAQHDSTNRCRVDIVKWSLLQSADDEGNLEDQDVRDNVALVATELSQLQLAAHYEGKGFTVIYERRIGLLMRVVERYAKPIGALCARRLKRD